MRRIFLASLFAGFALVAAGPVSVWAQNPTTRPVTAAPPVFTDAQKADLRRISTYLNGLKNVQGKFLQIGADGKSEEGTFYFRKPGRMRFEYQKPNPNLIIADGTTVAVENSQLKTTDRYPLGSSPLRLMLSENIDLSSDPRISAVRREAGAVSVTARETSGPATGSITLTFADAGAAGLELRQWQVVDAQGMRTTIVVNEMHQVANIPPQLFVITELSPFKKN
jgi:outer membrane lipoprotein-sorting protein